MKIKVQIAVSRVKNQIPAAFITILKIEVLRLLIKNQSQCIITPRITTGSPDSREIGYRGNINIKGGYHLTFTVPTKTFTPTVRKKSILRTKLRSWVGLWILMSKYLISRSLCPKGNKLNHLALLRKGSILTINTLTTIRTLTTIDQLSLKIGKLSARILK